MLDNSSGANASAVLVIGLGRFGTSVARSLEQLGHEVLGVESSPDIVQSLSGTLANIVQADATDEETLRQLGAADFPHAVVSIGHHLEASVLTILNLSQLGHKDIWAKANTAAHGRIAERVGAHHVVYPEADMGVRVAHLVTGKMMDFIEFSDGFAIAKTGAPRETHGKALSESNVRQRYRVTVVGIKRPRQDFIYATAQTIIESGDHLLVTGQTPDVERFAARP